MNPEPQNRAFDHVLVIMFENQYRGYVMANPYFRRLARQGIDMAAYFGVMHPSQTNYIASIAGELCNVTDDEQPARPLTQRTIVDLIEESPEGLTWKAYMDSYIPQNTPWCPALVPNSAWHFLMHDHAKWAVSRDPDKQDETDWVIVADINRIDSQFNRGGGGIAFRNKKLARSLHSIIRMVPPPEDEAVIETAANKAAATRTKKAAAKAPAAKQPAVRKAGKTLANKAPARKLTKKQASSVRSPAKKR